MYMFHPFLIMRIIGFLLLLEALALVSCLGISIGGGEPIVMSYIKVLLLLLVVGTLLVFS